MVTRIDHLARSLRDLQNIVHDLRQRGVALKATEQPIDTTRQPLTLAGTKNEGRHQAEAGQHWRICVEQLPAAAFPTSTEGREELATLLEFLREGRRPTVLPV